MMMTMRRRRRSWGRPGAPGVERGGEEGGDDHAFLSSEMVRAVLLLGGPLVRCLVLRLEHYIEVQSATLMMVVTVIMMMMVMMMTTATVMMMTTSRHQHDYHDDDEPGDNHHDDADVDNCAQDNDNAPLSAGEEVVTLLLDRRARPDLAGGGGDKPFDLRFCGPWQASDGEAVVQGVVVVVGLVIVIDGGDGGGDDVVVIIVVIVVVVVVDDVIMMMM
jgi:hypothetical protein